MRAPTDARSHYVPTSFDLLSDFTFHPVHWDQDIDGLERTCADIDPKAVLSILPPALQIDPLILSFLHRTQRLGMTVSSGNVPLALDVMRQLGADLVVATPKTASAFSLSLSARDLSRIRAWHVIVSAREAGTAVAVQSPVFKDLHVYPGISVASQCTHLSPHAGLFHPSDRFEWMIEGTEVHVSSVDGSLSNVRLCSGAVQQQPCACGAVRTLHVYGA